MAQDINITFSRELLKMVFADVRKHFPDIKANDAWVYGYNVGRGNATWEFHGPDKFMWHGSADNAYDARQKGWSAWLRNKGIEA